MSPETVHELRAFLSAVQRLLSEGPRAHPSWLKTCDDLLAALPPDPGGEMPEPWPGMVVTIFSGARHIVTSAHPHPRGWLITPTGLDWDNDNIREIRTQDGRVLWRAGEK